jgi:hypothetical protein
LLDVPDYLGGQFRVVEKLVDQSRQHLLSGDAGKPKSVGGFTLPDVEGAVGGRGKVDGSPGALPARPLTYLVPDAGETFGRVGFVEVRR